MEQKKKGQPFDTYTLELLIKIIRHQAEKNRTHLISPANHPNLQELSHEAAHKGLKKLLKIRRWERKCYH